MKFILALAIALLGSAAHAQQPSLPGYTTNGSNWISVKPTTPLPVTPSAPSGTYDTNIKQWDGTALGLPSAFGTSPGAVTVPGVNAALPPVTGTVAPGTPATNSVLTGCQYIPIANSLSPTNLQQMGVGCNQDGRLSVVAGTANQITSTPTIQAAAYASGNCIGGFNAVSVASYNGQSGFVTNVRLASIAGTLYQIILYMFDSNPTTSTCTDKGVFTLSANDVDKLIAQPTAVTLASPSGSITPTTAAYDFLPPRPFIAGGAAASGVQTIYYGLIASAAITPTTTSDLHLRFGVARE